MERYVPLYSPPEMIIQGMGIFRSISKPRVIWLGINPIPELEDLKIEIDRELGQIESVLRLEGPIYLPLNEVRFKYDGP